jgi:muramoyltetrapeptide carboxypeptidase
MIRPELLRKGDKICILAPARRVSQSDLEPAITIFKSWGLEVVSSANLYSKSHSYLAGSDIERLQDLQTAINDPSIKAIISARGGYGSSRIIDQLDISQLLKHPKWIVGFSDITALHLKVLKAGIISIHATMPVLFSRKDSAKSVESLRRILFENEFSIQAESTVQNRLGESSGILMGGNLSLIIDSLGTSSEPDTTGAILIIEEIDEYLYRLDRMMTHLKRAGKLAGIKGLVVGHMTDMKDSELPFGESVEDMIMNAVREYKFPVAFQFPSGHENPNLAWRHGEVVFLNVVPSGSSLSSIKPSA